MKTMGSVLVLALAAAGAAGAAQAGDVVVDVSGVQARGGVLYAGLQTREQFMKPQGAFGTAVQGPKAGSLRLVIHDVAPGEYALGLLHDANGDGQLQSAANGLPLEGVGASPSRTPVHGRPTFDQMKITVPAEGAAVTAQMTYYDGKVPGAR